MTTTPRVSVVIASHGRPEALTTCLNALRFQTYRPFEVIVVACAAGLKAVQALPFHDNIKQVAQATGGLSVARNQGIAEAAGDIIAFLDDDAVADPPWIKRLVGALQDTGAAGVGGWVRTSNGISFEWTGGAVSNDLIWDRGAATVMGTNMAFMAEPLRKIGGFDPSFPYYLDEADLTARMDAAGLQVANAPRAQVHHFAAPSPWRGKGRVPRNLHQIGHSEAVFLKRHAADPKAAWPRLEQAQRRRLTQMMVSGPLGPEEIGRLMKDYRDGFNEGLTVITADLPPLKNDPPAFLQFQTSDPKPATYLSGRIWQRRNRLRKARQLAKEGAPVCLFLFSPTLLFHRRRFLPEGIWIQSGGLWGRSTRSTPLASFSLFSVRLKKEVTLLAESFSD